MTEDQNRDKPTGYGGPYTTQQKFTGYKGIDYSNYKYKRTNGLHKMPKAFFNFSIFKHFFNRK